MVVPAVLLAVGGAPLRAQTPGQVAPAAGAGQVRGVVVDAETGTPVATASVALRSLPDSTLAAGAMARQDGSFLIEGLRPGRYYVRVSMIGYQPHTTGEFAITAASPQVNLGAIRLSRAPIALEGFEVEVERPMVTVAPDRNTYRAKDVAPAAANATDVLEAVPSVQVDMDGKVSLRGNENVVVQINGRPTPLRGTQLGAYLRQIPASAIERVEVVPNPSAKYDPEGMGGIINIVLKQNVDLGWSGGATLAAATEQRYTASGNLGYQRGPVTLSLSYGYNSDEREVTGINDRTRLAGSGAPLSFTEQDISGTEDNGGHNLNASVDYRLSPRDLLSASLALNRRAATNYSLSAYSELDDGRLLLDRYDRIRDTEAENLMVDYALAFKRTFQPQRHELAVELRFNRMDDEDRTGLWRQPSGGAPGGTGSRSDAETDETDAVADQLTLQADYTRSLTPRTRLEAGYKGNARWLDRSFLVRTDSLGTGDWTRSDLSNALEFDEQVNAVYGVLSHAAGKLELQAGLRAEYTSREFSLAGSGESFPHSYASFFPSGLVSYKPSDNSEVKLSYSRRIRRPGVQELNPFPVFFDLQNVFLGNPRLDPEYTDAIELGFQRSGHWGSLQVSPFYRRTTDIIRIIISTADTVAGREVTSVSFQNLDTGTSWGADVNGSLRLGRVFNGLVGFNVFKMVTDGSSGESALSSDAVTWMARFNGTFNLTPKTALQLMYFYRAPMDIERGRFASVSMTNLSVRHKLLGDRLTATLRVSDPFETMRFHLEARDDRLVQITKRAFNARAVYLTLQYNFGQAPRIQPRRPEQAPDAQPGFMQE